MTQAQFGELVGISQQAVSEFVRVAALGPGVSGGEMLRAYCERLREVAAGRGSMDSDGLDLVQERAALARSQREGQEIKNATARKTYAPIALLAETLAAASQAVVERFEQLPGQIKRACPDMPESARDVVMSTIAAARNEWVNGTRKLLAEQLAGPDVDADDDLPEDFDA